ncbi:MAG TPA: hypothetical protein VFW93_08975 [Aquabacterium sp.]|uniref:hypothetical protein n=1 Tax=Aquabacterium sp. TaxID=1872578 RepID=UPI002E31C6E8|nr:hypothetical protein [Aquabacterium sp.]HEX5356339.1 hypothetical protein [Aquabacterium sp.]
MMALPWSAWFQRKWLQWRHGPQDGPPEVLRARQLIAAVDKGGLPLNPAIVNQIARSLGLDVSSRAPIDQTVERIRQALARL